jgi:hypothetical protein
MDDNAFVVVLSVQFLPQRSSTVALLLAAKTLPTTHHGLFDSDFLKLGRISQTIYGSVSASGTYNATAMS